MKKLVVLSRTYCHLCDDMIAALQLVQSRVSSPPASLHGVHNFQIEVVDIDQHPSLEPVWGDKVPVLLMDEDGGSDARVEICHYFLDEAALLARLSVTSVSPN